MCQELAPEVPLVSGWPQSVRSVLLHVISMAHYAIVTARGWAANSINARVRLNSRNDQLEQEVELLREQLRIKDARMTRIHPKYRPHYRPVDQVAVHRGRVHHAQDHACLAVVQHVRQKYAPLRIMTAIGG